jgi:uncharacterized protein YjiS (DUF1127 family)
MLLKLRLSYVDVSAPWRVLRHCFVRAQAMCQAIQERRALAMMDTRMLADIGLSRAEAETEINRKPWDTAPR